MIQKYVYGMPFDTEAVVVSMEASQAVISIGMVDTENGFCYSYELHAEDAVYGLGENAHGINKRGACYISSCADNPNHVEDIKSLYGAHNFLIVSGEDSFGLFFDYPAAMTFDVGFSKKNILSVSCERADLCIYLITGESLLDLVKQFRKMIGQSYIPPKFAFGFGQSRWGYRSKEDFREVVREHRINHVPLDLVYMDIDYMQDFKDFSVNEEIYGDLEGFREFVSEMKQEKVHLIPIIDAGVKCEEGYDVYEEGIANQYFCTKEDGSPFVAAVWPGEVHFPDFLNPKARQWFGEKYKRFLDCGIDGFWNDMNEPAIFYTPEGLKQSKTAVIQFEENPTIQNYFHMMDSLPSARIEKDYELFYHNVNGEKIKHKDIHNLFGYCMTKAAGEAIHEMKPRERVLLFSRASYIGMHRYGGIWTGDNASWWSHILMNLQMLPGLNMAGFLYTGADLGGFGSDASRELLLRWLALGVFTPLMRNHSAQGTRRQEFYQFEESSDFAHVISVRYRLLPYLYSEFMKAVLSDEMMFQPLAFVYPNDSMAKTVEDQLMLGNELMLAPVYTKNAKGRYVYLPEEMQFVKFTLNGIVTKIYQQGIHFVEIACNEVAFFVRKGTCIPVAEKSETVAEVDYENLTLIGYEGATYELYNDDGITTDYMDLRNLIVLKK